MLKLDNTIRSSHARCKRLHYWRTERNLSTTKGSTALRYGITWHAAMEGFYKHIMEHGWTHDGKAIEAAISSAKTEWAIQSSKFTFFDDYRTLENCMKALIAYISHFNYDEGMLKITAVEQVFQILMTCQTPQEAEAFSYIPKEGFWFTGRLDLGVELDGRPWHGEHKSTGEALSKHKQRLQRNPQNIGYAYASQKITDDPPEGTLMILHHLSAYKSRTTGLYGEAKIDFDRVPQIYTDGDLENWRISLLDTANEILQDRERNIWPMREDNCYMYGRCGFAPLCEQNAPLGKEILEGFFEAEPWDVTKQVPEKELIVVEGGTIK